MNSGFNIIEEHLIDVSSADYVDTKPFFFHSISGGVVTYVPWGNKSTDNAITKTIDPSDEFNRITQCRKIIAATTTATGIYIGYPR